MIKPDKIVTWAEGGTVVEPSAGKKNDGWVFQERPASSFMNWILLFLGRWTAFVNAVFANRGVGGGGYGGPVGTNPSDACLTLGSDGGLVVTQDTAGSHAMRHYSASGAQTAFTTDVLTVNDGLARLRSTRVESTQPNPIVDDIYVDLFDNDPAFDTYLRADVLVARLASLQLDQMVATSLVSGGLNRFKVADFGLLPTFTEANAHRAIGTPPAALVGDSILCSLNAVRAAGVIWNDNGTLVINTRAYNVDEVLTGAVGEYDISFVNPIPCESLGGTLFPVGVTATVGWQPGYQATGNQYAVQLGPCAGAIGAATGLKLTVYNTTTGAAADLPPFHFVSFMVV